MHAHNDEAHGNCSTTKRRAVGRLGLHCAPAPSAVLSVWTGTRMDNDVDKSTAAWVSAFQSEKDCDG